MNEERFDLSKYKTEIEGIYECCQKYGYEYRGRDYNNCMGIPNYEIICTKPIKVKYKRHKSLLYKTFEAKYSIIINFTYKVEIEPEFDYINTGERNKKGKYIYYRVSPRKVHKVYKEHFEEYMEFRKCIEKHLENDLSKRDYYKEGIK